ncbi:transcriptional regulator [Xenorhabdus bovienii]|uniref:transcriptional regulator n=1 Tax=Xenorhabdus bovienii TaxID=40576 RepID=UPI0021584501|nr:transcriptional regulator [Xenorhabdus bovienii]
MKIIVMNNSGNVGKTTICQNMLVPRLDGIDVIRVETLNDDGESTGEKLGADLFDEIFQSILSSENVLVDVGASNVEVFNYKLENEFVGSHSFIDWFIVPVTPDEKQQRDTITTIKTLIDIGVNPEKIKVVFNRLNVKKDLLKQFETLICSDDLKEYGYSFYSEIPLIGINNTTLFETLKKANIEYGFIKSVDMESLKQQITEAKDAKEKSKFQLLQFYRMGFDSYQSNLQDIFDSLELKLF